MLDSLELMRKTLEYRGGVRQVDRMYNDKLRTLKRTLLYSDQSATAEFERLDEEGNVVFKQFRCLMNPNKLTGAYDQKVLSIPYYDVCLNENLKQDTNVAGGQIFRWVETNTYWIIYTENLEETPYFRAGLYKANEEVEINKHKYRVYLRGVVETTIPWNNAHDKSWNDLNWTHKMIIQKTDETLDFFHRFQMLKVRGQTFEVQTVDIDSGDNCITVHLKEYFNNTIKETIYDVEHEEQRINDSTDIIGENVVYPYSIYTYELTGPATGAWEIDEVTKAKIIDSSDTSVTIEITTGKQGDFNLMCGNVIFPIHIDSL